MKSIVFVLLLCSSFLYQQHPKKKTAKKMSDQEEFQGTPVFLDTTGGNAFLAFRESAKEYTFPATEQHYEAWITLLRKAMKEKATLKVKAERDTILSLE